MVQYGKWVKIKEPPSSLFPSVIKILPCLSGVLPRSQLAYSSIGQCEWNANSFLLIMILLIAIGVIQASRQTS